MDSLMFIRGWNSLLPEFLGREPQVGGHLIEFIEAVRGRIDDRILTSNLRSAVRDFWFWTAEFVDTPAHTSLVRRLAESEIFRREWVRLAFLDEEDEKPVGAPNLAWRPDLGRVLIYQYSVVFPPNYFLRQFVPADAQARTTMAKLSRDNVSVFLTPLSHWRQTAGS